MMWWWSMLFLCGTSFDLLCEVPHLQFQNWIFAALIFRDFWIQAPPVPKQWTELALPQDSIGCHWRKLAPAIVQWLPRFWTEVPFWWREIFEVHSNSPLESPPLQRS